MRCIQCICDLHPEVQQPGIRHCSPVIKLVEALPLQQFHHDEGLIAAFIQFVNGTDARMIQRGGRACFAPETFQRRRVWAGRFGQHLDGDRPPELQVFGLIYNAHPAPAQATDHSIVAKQRTGAQFLHATIMQRRTPRGKCQPHPG
jgi:hypothetical protein